MRQYQGTQKQLELELLLAGKMVRFWVRISLNIHPRIILARVAEALAIRDGLELGMALKIPWVSIKSDSEAIVRSCLD